MLGCKGLRVKGSAVLILHLLLCSESLFVSVVLSVDRTKLLSLNLHVVVYTTYLCGIQYHHFSLSNVT